jgi:RNA polymerase sigma factor (sigma-70 family)
VDHLSSESGSAGDGVADAEPLVGAELPAGWLTASVERRLIKAVQSGSHGDRERAVGRLLRAFQPLLRASVRRWSGLGADADELQQVAEIAFVRAVSRFDLRQPWRLSTYARVWVEGAVRREATTEAAEIRIPRRLTTLVRKIEATRWRLAQELGREPALAELAFELGMQPSEIEQVMQLPRKAWPLESITNGETGVLVGGDQRRFDSRAGVVADEAEEELEQSEYTVGEVDGLLRNYQGLRSGLEVPEPSYGEPRLRRRNRQSTLCRLTDLDYALQRVDGVRWVVLELAGMRDLSLRALEELLGVRHSTLQYRMKVGNGQLVSLMNVRSEPVAARRLVYWRRLFAWSLGDHAWLEGDGQPEPIAFEVWARIGQAGILALGGRMIPIRALAAFGEGWLITPELIARSTRDTTNPKRTSLRTEF